MPSLKEEAQVLLRRLEAAARKKLGQNFMVDEKALLDIASSLDVHDGETVVEIGPGLGFLTRFLLKRGASVVAIEKDPAYARFLAGHFADRPFQVEEGDVLETDLARLVEGRVKVFGNIPYNITSPILEWLIGHRRLVSDAVLTVQWEVAERLAAKPGGKDWGSLSVFLQYHAEVRTVRKIGRSSFSPAPNVDSAVIHVHFPEKPKIQAGDEAFFFAIVRRAFQKRRKTLLNALASEEDPRLAKKSLEAALSRTGIDPARRPETLSVAEWAKLAAAL